MTNIDDDRLRVTIVWLPMLRSDSRLEAVEGSLEFSDARLSYFWDEAKLSGASWQDVLEIGGIAWDVYLLYDAGAGWGRNPEYPDFWMHQLAVEGVPRLDSDQLQKETRRMLSTIGD